MPKFRKKPVEIEAMQFTDESKDAVFAWARRSGACGLTPSFNIRNEPCLLIPTLEGEMRADLGDWVIRGVAGEFYPCKPDIFEATYEAVVEEVR